MSNTVDNTHNNIHNNTHGNRIDVDHDYALGLARRMMQMAYAPYSNFLVGAVVYADDGRYYAGCNVENASYGLGSCAETAAIAHMRIHGGRHIRAVWVMGAGDSLVTPCGGCRQRLREFAVTLDMPVFVCCPERGVRLTTTISDLLPHAFGPDNLP